MTQLPAPAYTPALGPRGSIELYDRVIALLTREEKWRAGLLVALAPRDEETIVDIGAGTASMACLIKTTQPGVRMVAIDPDPDIRTIAEAKAVRAGAAIEFVTAMGDKKIDDIVRPGSADKILISLVLHQCPVSVKTSILANAFRLLNPGGKLLIADYGRQRSILMKLAFNLVRLTDGYADTRANKDGRLPEFMRGAGFVHVKEQSITLTPTGSISIYSGTKPQAHC